MFGVSRKKKAKPVLSFADEELEDEAPQSPQERKRKRKEKKKKSTAMLSFDPDDNDQERVEKNRRKKKKKSSGMGYGGMMMSEEVDEDVPMDHDYGSNKDETSQYDMAALNKLKMEQKRRKEINVNKDNISVVHQSIDQTQQIKDESHDKAEEYISLSGDKSTSRSDPIVLTGDEAMAYVEDSEPAVEFDHGLEQQSPSVKQSSAVDKDTKLDEEAPNEEVEEDNRQWEDNMARRAGVLPPTSAHTSNTSSKKYAQLSPPTPLSQIKSSLQPTITNLENISLDLETAIHRHESNLSSTRDDLSKHQTTLEDHGAALEYYQVLRSELADWMGALRQVKSMVDAAYDARRNWEGNVTLTRFQRGYEWSEDVKDVLKGKGLIERVVGCDGNEELEEEVGGVDEFGRDLSSMVSMARTRRWQTRQRNFLQKEEIISLQKRMECRSSDNFSLDEVEDWKQRDEALKEAIAIIPSVVNDEYLSVSNLCNLFFQWQDKYPDDYKSSYAEMTLVSMLSVLVQLELCQRWDGLGLMEYLHRGRVDISAEVANVNKFRLVSELTRAIENRSNETNDSSTLLQAITEKCILPYLLDYLDIDSAIDTENRKYHGLYDPTSISETESLCFSMRTLFGGLYGNPFHDKKIRESSVAKVKTSLLSLLKYHLDKRATVLANTKNVVIVNDGLAMKDGKQLDAETNDALSFAIYSQANELTSLVTNISSHWYPTIVQVMKSDCDDILQFVLVDVISLRILPVLQTFQTVQDTCNGDNIEVYRKMQRNLISLIYHAVKNMGLFGKEEWMLVTAPLRAIAQTIEVS